ncbi:SDR family oxidoreductase [Rhizomonospora bruguierae]|uniref:SDR family oxidoreductase n=1 Tax=Rhizomonospora bruguierae TaxID=1581705 RepID=UPI001BCD18DE|nr:SDR family oxidoreductase [Micromonospora sp. NBRC 107566]
MPLTHKLARSVVVITGASSGIGAATALDLARRGTMLALAGRAEAPLRTVATRCSDLGGPAIAVRTDVTDPVQQERLAARALDRFGRIDAWVNNAAVGTYQLLPHASAAEFRRIIETNLLGVAYGCMAAIPPLRAAGGGVIVNHASALADASLPYLSAYTAAKHGVRGLSDSLRQDLRVTGDTTISVCTLLPATLDTPFWDHAGNHSGRSLRPPPPVYPPELAARAIRRLLQHPRRQVYVGGAARLLAVASRLTPGLMDRFLGMYGARALFRPDMAPTTEGNIFRAVSGEEPRVDGGWHGRRRHATRTAVVMGAAAGVAAALARRPFRPL